MGSSADGGPSFSGAPEPKLDADEGTVGNAMWKLSKPDSTRFGQNVNPNVELACRQTIPFPVYEPIALLRDSRSCDSLVLPFLFWSLFINFFFGWFYG